MESSSFLPSGRNVLIKLDASAILVYNMSVLPLSKKKMPPTKLIKALEKFGGEIMAILKKFHIIKWSQLCKPISNGELGISDTKTNNLAPYLKCVGST